MKRILFISNYKPGTGGISGQVEILQRKLREEGYVADIFNTKGSTWYRLTLFHRLRKLGKDYGVFHIHCCSGWGFLPAVVGIKVGKRLGKRIILTYHGGGAAEFFAKHSRLVKKYLNQTDTNIVLSGFLGSVFDKYQIPYIVIPNIIELDGSRFRKRENLQPKYICIRTLDPLYNIECILKAFKIVMKTLPEATLTLVGDGTERDRLEQYVKDHGINDVRFVGRVDNKEIYHYLDEADIMLSAPHIDNMPVSLLEAFNAGLLVISSRVGGVPYMIEDGVNGVLFENDNHHQLAEKMLWTIENQPIFMIDNAQETLIRYSWESVRELLMSKIG